MGWLFAVVAAGVFAAGMWALNAYMERGNKASRPVEKPGGMHVNCRCSREAVWARDKWLRWAEHALAPNSHAVRALLMYGVRTPVEGYITFDSRSQAAGAEAERRSGALGDHMWIDECRSWSNSTRPALPAVSTEELAGRAGSARPGVANQEDFMPGEEMDDSEDFECAVLDTARVILGRTIDLEDIRAQEPGLLELRALCRRCHEDRVGAESIRAEDDGREPEGVPYLGVAEFRKRMARDVGLRYPELDGFGAALRVAWCRTKSLESMLESGEAVRIQYAARLRAAA